MLRTDSNDPCESVVLAHPTIDRLQNLLAAESTEVRRNTIRRFLRREGRRFWKKPCSPARPDPSEGPGRKSCEPAGASHPDCMDASRNPRTALGVTGRQISVSYPACRCGTWCPPAPMDGICPSAPYFCGGLHVPEFKNPSGPPEGSPSTRLPRAHTPLSKSPTASGIPHRMKPGVRSLIVPLSLGPNRLGAWEMYIQLDLKPVGLRDVIPSRRFQHDSGTEVGRQHSTQIRLTPRQ